MTDGPLLELRELRRTFGSTIALDGLTLTLARGSIGLLGPNGAGKSTLLKLVMGLIPPTSGSGTLLGRPLGEGCDLRRLVGFMPERDALVPGLTGVEYVTLAGELCGLPRKQAKRRAQEMLDFLRLDDARHRKVEDYSAGMKQRVKLAQALIHDPELLLLDEPTSGLDPAGRDAMLGLIRELGNDHGKSVIVSTHLLADVRAVCGRVVMLFGGKLRGEGTVVELCAPHPDRYRLRVFGDPARFREALIAAGVRMLPEARPGELRLQAAPGWDTARFFALAAEMGVAIRSLQPDDDTLEDVFVREAG